MWEQIYIGVLLECVYKCILVKRCIASKQSDLYSWILQLYSCIEKVIRRAATQPPDKCKNAEVDTK